jgi:hypothetical protein
MSDYEKMEWVHSQISELKNGVDVDLDTMHSFIEELRNKYYFNNNGQLKDEIVSTDDDYTYCVGCDDYFLDDERCECEEG